MSENSGVILKMLIILILCHCFAQVLRLCFDFTSVFVHCHCHNVFHWVRSFFANGVSESFCVFSLKLAFRAKCEHSKNSQIVLVQILSIFCVVFSLKFPIFINPRLNMCNGFCDICLLIVEVCSLVMNLKLLYIQRHFWEEDLSKVILLPLVLWRHFLCC